MNLLIHKLKSEIENRLKNKNKDYTVSHHIIYNDAMETEIFNGDEVKVDESYKVVNENDIFLFKDENNETIVARCKIYTNNYIYLKFNNKNCEDKVFHINELSLIGKVILASLNYLVLASDLCSLKFEGVIL